MSNVKKSRKMHSGQGPVASAYVPVEISAEQRAADAAANAAAMARFLAAPQVRDPSARGKMTDDGSEALRLDIEGGQW